MAMSNLEAIMPFMKNLMRRLCLLSDVQTIAESNQFRQGRTSTGGLGFGLK